MLHSSTIGPAATGYERLGIIYEEQKDLRRSLNALMLAATIKKKVRAKVSATLGLLSP